MGCEDVYLIKLVLDRIYWRMSCHGTSSFVGSGLM